MTMWIRFIRWLASHLQVRRIEGEDGTLYLERFKVFGWMPGDKRKWPVSIYLHRFARADLDDAPHSHPWRWAMSLVLAGGYLERRVVSPKRAQWFMGHIPMRIFRLRAGRVNFLRDTSFHCVAELYGETWTLFMVGPKSSTWGFEVPNRGFVQWRDRLRERGIDPSY